MFFKDYILQIDNRPITKPLRLDEACKYIGQYDIKSCEDLTPEQQKEGWDKSKELLSIFFDDKMRRKDFKEFVDEWCDRLRKAAAPLSSEEGGITDMWDLVDIVENTHKHSNTLVYYEGEIVTFGDFVAMVWEQHKEGTQFYRGSVVGYKWA